MRYECFLLLIRITAHLLFDFCVFKKNSLYSAHLRHLLNALFCINEYDRVMRIESIRNQVGRFAIDGGNTFIESDLIDESALCFYDWHRSHVAHIHSSVVR